MSEKKLPSLTLSSNYVNFQLSLNDEINRCQGICLLVDFPKHFWVVVANSKRKLFPY
jgi:hypothetical protein